uniref:Uncharacterized protein n=1 Tax=Cacopsylla melanoneura TaxID=428564 RepID=A0A8D9BJJ4_9HEMI
MCTKTWKIKLAIPGVTSQKLCYDFITWYHTPRLIQLFLIHFINIYLSDGFIIGKFYYFISFSIYIFIIIYSFSFFFSHIHLRLTVTETWTVEIFPYKPMHFLAS